MSGSSCCRWSLQNPNGRCLACPIWSSSRACGGSCKIWSGCEKPMLEGLPTKPMRWPGYSHEYEDGRTTIIVFAGVRACNNRQNHPARGAARPSSPLWGETYLSRDALARAKAQMDEESMGVRDEIGFLTVHQGYADRFSPAHRGCTPAPAMLSSRPGCSRIWRD